MPNMSEWKHTLTIEKADFGDDRWIIEGVVTGPGYVDAEGDEFLPQAIQGIADFINSNPIPLMDWHGKNAVNTIMDAELGEVYKAWVDDEGLLRVAAELDKDVPTSQWLRKKMDPNMLPPGKEPKKFGMSVKGLAQNVRGALQDGKLKRQIADLIPSEVSLTTRPFFQPSFGTVISKAMDEASAESVAGDKSSMSDEVTPQVDQDVKPESESDSDKVLDAAADAGVETTPDSDTVKDAAESADDVAVEKSDADKEAEALTLLITNIVRREIGNSKVEPVVPSAPETPADTAVEKAQDDQPDRLAVIEKALADLGVNVERLLENTPEVSAPGVLVAKSDVDTAREAFASMDASQRIRAGFQLAEQKLR